MAKPTAKADGAKLDHKVEFMAPGKLTPYERNPLKHPPEQIDQIVASIKQFGFTLPVLCDENYMILAGHGRQLAAVQMELAQVPVIRRFGLTPAQKRAYVIADNKIARNADFDWQLISEGLKDLREEGIELDLTGFRDFEYEPLLQANWQPTLPGPHRERQNVSVSVTTDQLEIINQAWEKMKEREESPDMSVGRTLELLAADYLAS